jgi:probable HAF family extracellular repeat protein
MPSYTITDLGALPQGSFSMGMGLDAAGRAVGGAQSGGGPLHAFLHSSGGWPYLGVPIVGMVDLGTLGGRTSVAAALNAAGHVAGSSLTARGAVHAFFYDVANINFARYRGGLLQDLGTLGGANSSAAAIDAADRVVGSADLSSGDTHAALFTSGKPLDLGTLGGKNSAATTINAAGMIAGGAQTAGGDTHAFLYTGGPLRDLGILGGKSSVANAINDAGMIAGSVQNAGGATHAFLYSGGTMQDLGTLGGSSSYALGLNASGQVVGKSQTAGGEMQAFLYNGSMLNLNSLLPPGSGWVLGEAAAINDAGQITGTGRYQNAVRAFLLTPAQG